MPFGADRVARPGHLKKVIALDRGYADFREVTL
jgi:hypothetical protein